MMMNCSRWNFYFLYQDKISPSVSCTHCSFSSPCESLQRASAFFLSVLYVQEKCDEAPLSHFESGWLSKCVCPSSMSLPPLSDWWKSERMMPKVVQQAAGEPRAALGSDCAALPVNISPICTGLLAHHCPAPTFMLAFRRVKAISDQKRLITGYKSLKLKA